MLTIDEIKEISFRTVGKKGYYGEEVDAFIDEVIAPEETRRKIRFAFESLSSKERSELSLIHGNIPL